MTLVEQILTELWNTELRYKGVTVNIFGIPRFKSTARSTIRHTLNRLESKGYLLMGEDGVRLTKVGKHYVQRKMESLRNFEKPIGLSKDKTLLVLFDIPENMKAHREWFRWHLKKFGYTMIQKSVWIGPSPLPKDFSDYTKEVGLKDCIKSFKLAKSYQGR